MSEQKAREREAVIRIRQLVNAFGDSIIHDRLDLDVYRGEVLGVVGGSGTGKSVLLRSIIGLNRPRSGSIRVFGQETAEDDSEDLRGLQWPGPHRCDDQTRIDNPAANPGVLSGSGR